MAHTSYPFVTAATKVGTMKREAVTPEPPSVNTSVRIKKKEFPELDSERAKPSKKQKTEHQVVNTSAAALPAFDTKLPLRYCAIGLNEVAVSEEERLALAMERDQRSLYIVREPKHSSERPQLLLKVQLEAYSIGRAVVAIFQARDDLPFICLQDFSLSSRLKGPMMHLVDPRLDKHSGNDVVMVFDQAHPDWNPASYKRLIKTGLERAVESTNTVSKSGATALWACHQDVCELHRKEAVRKAANHALAPVNAEAHLLGPRLPKPRLPRPRQPRVKSEEMQLAAVE